MSFEQPERGGVALLEILRRPPQGWSSLSLFLGMLTVVGISIADARPLEVGGQERSGSLLVVMIAAALVGFVIARSSLGIVRSHVLGAGAGAAVLLLTLSAASGQASNLLPSSWEEFNSRMGTLGAVLEADVDRWLLGAGDVPYSATLLVLGAIAWTTGQFGAFSIFRYDRAGPAVLATAVLLFLNVAAPALGDDGRTLPVIPVLALYSALAMLLLVRLQLAQQGYNWARRHIADAAEVSRLFLRTGTLFVLITVLGASSLTAVAVAGPLSVDLDDLEQPLEEVSEQLSRLLAIFAVPIPDGQAASTFEDTFKVADNWERGPGTAFNASADTDLRGNYWWGGAYNRFDSSTSKWSRDDPSEEELGAWQRLPGDATASALGRATITTTIEPLTSSLARGTLLGLSEAQAVDRAVTVKTMDGGRSLADIVFADDIEEGASYEVRSLVWDYVGQDRTLTANALRGAGTDYPAWVIEGYTEKMQPGSARLTRAKAREIEAGVAADPARNNPYDKALNLQDWLGGLDYEIDLRGRCGDLNTPECLLTIQKGFCQQFATTMAMVLREMEIPSRLVQGYLPGTRLPDGSYEVPNQALHAWVEVYFPGFGWVRFDPTPSSGVGIYNQAVTDFAPGPPRPRLDPPGAGETPSPLASPEASLAPEPSGLGVAGTESTDAGGGDLAASALAVGGLVTLALLLLFVALLLRLRRLPSADGTLAYRGIVSLASRLGYGPHPSQTEYEYATSLSETLPSVRDDLYRVADARVESAYGQREPSGDRVAALRRSYAKIRTALLGLMFRRGS